MDTAPRRHGGILAPVWPTIRLFSTEVAMFRRTILSGAALVTLVLCTPDLARAVLHPGDVAPDFHKTDLTGTAQTLSQYRGKVVFLFLLGYN
jgi:hypothetical protein